MTMRAVLLVALGGAVGAAARYGVGVWALRFEVAPWGTWVVNAVGCLLIGVAIPVLRSDDLRVALLVGVLGAFTTFSTYSADTVLLWEAGQRGLAVANAVGSVVVGVVFVAVGLGVGRMVAPGS